MGEILGLKHCQLNSIPNNPAAPRNLDGVDGQQCKDEMACNPQSFEKYPQFVDLLGREHLPVEGDRLHILDWLGSCVSMRG